MIEWCKSRLTFSCFRCGKQIKPGRKLGLYLGQVYCWHCGHNIELAAGYRFIGRLDKEAISHLRSIGNSYKEREAKTATVGERC